MTGQLNRFLTPLLPADTFASCIDRVTLAGSQREKGTHGTDHGTAAPHFLLGGKVKGGLHGEQPNLTELQRADLRHSVGFRRLYTSVAQRWWGQTRVEWGQRFPALEIL